MINYPMEETTSETTNYPYSWGLNREQIEREFKIDSKQMVCITQLGHHLSRINHYWKIALGWEEDELLSGSYLRFIHPEDVEKTLEYDKHFIPTGFWNRWRCKDGSYRYLSWIGLAPVGVSSSVGERSTFSIVQDVTLEMILQEQKENQIRLLNDQLAFNKDVIHSILSITQLYLGPLANLGGGDDINSDDLVRHFIRLTESDFGFLVQQSSLASVNVSGQNWVYSTEIEPWSFSDSQLLKMNELIGRAQASNKIQLLERPSEEGSSTLVSFLVIPLLAGKHLIGLLVLGNRAQGYPKLLLQWLEPLLSLSTRLLMEVASMRSAARIQELEEAAKLAKSESMSKSNFLAHMAHELRTPLSGVIGLLDMVNTESSALTSADIKYLEMSKESATLLLRILNDILDLSTVAAGQLRLEELNFNPRGIAEEVVRFFSVQAEKKGIDMILHYSPQIPETLVGDPSRLRQILFNLVGNALKFTERGAVTIDFSGTTSPTCPGVFLLTSNMNLNYYTLDASVKDSGIGMTEETIAQIFQPFSQADSSISRRFGGTGLGLFICKHLCALMGGDIDVTSTVGAGSAFHFSVCLRLPEQENEAVQEQKKPRGQIPRLPALRILVAEDNGVNQLILKHMLAMSGCNSVTMVWNGVEVVDAAAAGIYDVVLMDVQMPVMDGLTATKIIRKHSSVPIIGITAHAMLSEQNDTIRSGMDACIVKPIDRKELVEAILRCLPPAPEPVCSKSK